MADESEGGQEKTEQPSEKRLREAREQGQAARSKELATAAIFGTAVATLWFKGGSIAADTAQWMRRALELNPPLQRGHAGLLDHAAQTLIGLIVAVSPIILFCLLATLIAPSALGGLRFSAKALTPDLTRLSPAKGLARMYGREALAEFMRSLLRLLLISALAIFAMWKSMPLLLGLIHQPLVNAAGDGALVVLQALGVLCIGLLLMAAADVPWQLWTHKKQLMMSREELRQEYKESEGNPEVKGRIRRLQQEMSQGRMLEAVPAADAILVNPTHYAVAIQYDALRMAAPIVVAKGVDEIAMAIRQVADAHRVPIVTTPPLARALYRKVQIGGEVPVTLYAAVAEVLGYVYQLKLPGRVGPPPTLPEITLPDGEG